MYSYEERKKAVDLYINNGKHVAQVIRELGYPSRQMLYLWYREFRETGNLRSDTSHSHSKYTEDQRRQAIAHYLAHGRSITRTMKALGFPRRTTLRDWLKEDLPGEGQDCFVSRTLVRCTPEQKEQAVLRLCGSDEAAADIATDYGVTERTLYLWKNRLLNKGGCASMPKKRPSKEVSSVNEHLKSHDDLLREKEALLQQLEELKRENYRLRLENDILEVAGEVIKKDRGINLKTLTNREKAVVIDVLRSKCRLKDLLDVLGMAKSSYCYQEQALQRPDKYTRLRSKVKDIFVDARNCYGYRRIHAMLQKIGEYVSEKVVRRIMREEKLAVSRPKTRKYNSYAGEVSPEVENLISRDFSADAPNTKWVTDITEFGIPAGKVYLSPIIDCFDGMAVSWTIGTSPNAELANTMLDAAVSTLGKEEHPLVHSDRGGHYRWPGWIDRMQEAGLMRSMSKKGCSPDNAACEGFFGTLKTEMFYGRSWLDVTVDEFINVLDDHLRWHNETRIKMSLGAMSPMEYRRSLGLYSAT